MPDTLHRKHLVIVGCGAAAVILLANLAKQSAAVNAPLLSISIIDDSPSVPCGLAFSVSHPAFILNVPAQRMGAFVDNPAHFYQWLQSTSQWRELHLDFATMAIGPDDFVPRMIYGAYLQHLFHSALERLKADGHNIELIAERVVAVERAGFNADVRTQGLSVVTHRNKRLPADALVMATGNCPAFNNAAFHNQDFYKPDSANAIFSSPYCTAANQCDWKSLRDLVVIGSGLSMVDAVQFTIAQGFSGRFHIFSAHNLLPLPHLHMHTHCQLPVFRTTATSAVSLLRDLRAYIQSNMDQGIAWQDSINQVRTGNNLIWSNLPDRERKRLRKCLPWWNILRHRIPANVGQQLDRLTMEGRLYLHKAKIKRIDAVASGIQLTLENKKKPPLNEQHQTIKIRADKAVICAGYLPGFQRVQYLCTGLLNDENELRMELGKPGQDFLLAADYEIYGIGPALGGVLFETTAIQEIRQQAQQIAQAIYTRMLLASPSNAQTAITLITPVL